MNVKFTYCYRDYANYKNHNEVILSNTSKKPIQDIEQFILDHLIDDRLFYSADWKVPDLHFLNWDSEIDHLFHEFVSICETNEKTSVDMSIDEFMNVIRSAQNKWKS